MSAVTSHLGLYKPGGGSTGLITPDEVADIDRLNANSDVLDAWANATDATLEGLKKVVPSVASSAARDTIFGSPVQGNRVWRTDKQWEESYFETYNAGTNPGGATPAGWYPVSGALPAADIRNHAATMAVPNGTMTLVTTLTVGTLGFAKDVTVTAGTLVITQPGMYEVSGSVAFDTLGTGGRIVQITVNSATDSPANYVVYGPPALSVGGLAYQAVPTDKVVQYLASGDVLRLFGYQSSGSTSNLASTASPSPAPAAVGRVSNYLRARYIGPRVGA